MYTEEFDRRPFPFRDFLLKVILVIIFVFLLVWLLPKFITPSSQDMADISPLTSQIFGDNLEKMKEAAISYYTNERLPQEVGESKQMTLREMIANNLVIPFVDKNGEACDVDGSYVKITKEDNEYLLKVNLKCSDQEDYILVHLGCYNYCSTDVCEKQATTVTTNPTEPSNTVNIKEDPSTSNPSSGEVPSDVPDQPEEPTTNPVPEEDVTLLYEYSKTTGARFSEWSDWSAWARNDERLEASNCNDSDPSCLRKVIIL